MGQITRNYVNAPEELGTAAQWADIIKQLYTQMPFPELWRPLKIEIWNMQRRDGNPLHNYDGKGNTATGLTWPGQNLIQLARFEGPNGIQNALKTLSHEAGHYYADRCGFDGKTAIQRTLTGLFYAMRPHQTEPEPEDFAECYRAILGADNVRYTFSDNKAFTASERLTTLFKTWFWLVGNVGNAGVSNFSIPGNYCQWLQTDSLFSYQWLAVDQNWVKYKWNGQSWLQI
jgi:hypothetical protein